MRKNGIIFFERGGDGVVVCSSINGDPWEATVGSADKSEQGALSHVHCRRLGTDGALAEAFEFALREGCQRCERSKWVQVHCPLAAQYPQEDHIVVAVMSRQQQPGRAYRYKGMGVLGEQEGRMGTQTSGCNSNGEERALFKVKERGEKNGQISRKTSGSKEHNANL